MLLRQAAPGSFSSGTRLVPSTGSGGTYPASSVKVGAMSIIDTSFVSVRAGSQGTRMNDGVPTHSRYTQPLDVNRCSPKFTPLSVANTITVLSSWPVSDSAVYTVWT